MSAQTRDAIDAAFAGMAEDRNYQTEAKAITDEFAKADWEAWRQAENKRVTLVYSDVRYHHVNSDEF